MSLCDGSGLSDRLGPVLSMQLRAPLAVVPFLAAVGAGLASIQQSPADAFPLLWISQPPALGLCNLPAGDSHTNTVSSLAAKVFGDQCLRWIFGALATRSQLWALRCCDGGGVESNACAESLCTMIQCL